MLEEVASVVLVEDTPAVEADTPVAVAVVVDTLVAAYASGEIGGSGAVYYQ
jgi:hypothetical protein